jgi:hypothetical protein
MVRKLDALVDDPSSDKSKTVLHVRFLDHPPLACIEAPITEFDVTVLKDAEYLDVRETLADSVFANMYAARLEGLHAMTRGIGEENELVNVYIAGWDSIEVCIFSVAYVLKEYCVDRLDGDVRIT